MAQGSSHARSDILYEDITSFRDFVPWKDAKNTLLSKAIRNVQMGRLSASLRHSVVAFLHRLGLTKGNTPQLLGYK